MKPLTILLALAALVAFGSAAYALAATPTRRAYLPMIICTGCTGLTSQPIPPTPIPPNPTPNPSSYAAQMIALVNQARVAAGCPTVVANATLMRAAQDWSHTMASTGNYNHSGGDFYSSYGYTWGALENIGPGATPEYAYEGWMLSAPHKRNIEFCYPTSDPSYNPARVYEVGVGYENGYWTLVIGWRVP
jgi:uncharacterized protein YkwD